MISQWRVAVIAAGSAIVLLLAGCTPSPVATTAPVVSAPVSASPTVVPGPTLTKAQFARLVASGKLGDRKVTLKTFSNSSGTDPDNEESENQQQSEATSCVKMNKLADAKLLAQAADDSGGAVVQTFTQSAVASELFTLNQKCAAEQAKLDSSTAVTTIDSGQDGSAVWWLLKDPEGNYQVTIAYGNLLAYVLMENANKPTALVTALISQADQLAKS